MAPKVTFAYWNARGVSFPRNCLIIIFSLFFHKRGEVIRLVLKYVGVDFEDKRYEVNLEDKQKSDWFRIKYTLGLDFPNVSLRFFSFAVSLIDDLLSCPTLLTAM